MTSDLNCGIAYHELFDSGGDTSSYSNNEDYVQTFCNPDTSKSVRISFRPNPSIDRQLSLQSSATGNDYLYIYNGATTQDNVMGVYTGNSSSSPQAGTYISSGGCLTVRMTSDLNYVADGFKARLYLC